MEMGQTYSKNERQQMEQTLHRSGNQGEGKDQVDNQAESGKVTWQRRREPPETGQH